MVKIRDVAIAAEVSAATVSRVLNGNPNVDLGLAARVRAAAQQLGYSPNGPARNLRRQATDLIALIISDVENPFFTAITRGAEDFARARGYSVLLCNADEDSRKESEYLAVAEREQVAGVILSPHNADADISRLKRAAIPVVIIDRELTRFETDTVVVQSQDGARLATEHLIEAGWQRPACITGPQDAGTAQARLQGYLEAIAARDGLEPNFRRVPYRWEGGRSAVDDLLGVPVPPDSIFVANGQMALGALAEIKRRGLVVGRDLGFIMFDDTPWAPLMTPAVSAIAQPAYEIGAAAARLLIEQSGAKVPLSPRRIVLATSLVTRESTVWRAKPD